MTCSRSNLASPRCWGDCRFDAASIRLVKFKTPVRIEFKTPVRNHRRAVIVQSADPSFELPKEVQIWLRVDRFLTHLPFLSSLASLLIVLTIKHVQPSLESSRLLSFLSVAFAWQSLRSFSCRDYSIPLLRREVVYRWFLRRQVVDTICVVKSRIAIALSSLGSLLRRLVSDRYCVV